MLLQCARHWINSTGQTGCFKGFQTMTDCLMPYGARHFSVLVAKAGSMGGGKLVPYGDDRYAGLMAKAGNGGGGKVAGPDREAQSRVKVVRLRA